MDKIVYLIGTGATMAEMEHQGIESYLSMPVIDEAVYEMSESHGGKYKQLHDNFSEEMTKIQSQINNRNIQFKEQLSNQLWHFLYTHINQIDYRFRDFFIEKGVT